jgi:hypothetical protein
MTTRRGNLLKRIGNVQRIVEENYEPGNQSKCRLQAYRQNVMDIYPMSERTFWRYVKTDVSKKKQREKDDPRQLKLEF